MLTIFKLYAIMQLQLNKGTTKGGSKYENLS